MNVIIRSADTLFYEGTAEEILLPSLGGGLGIRKGHTPLVTALKVGDITLITANNKQKVVCPGGIAEINNTSVNVFLAA